jgi:hypothetical protein
MLLGARSFMVISSCLKYVYDFKKEFNSAATPIVKGLIISKYRKLLQQNNERCPGLTNEINKEEKKLRTLKIEKFKAALAKSRMRLTKI